MVNLMSGVIVVNFVPVEVLMTFNRIKLSIHKTSFFEHSASKSKVRLLFVISEDNQTQNELALTITSNESFIILMILRG